MNNSNYAFSKATFMPFHMPDRFGFKLAGWYALILLLISAITFPLLISLFGKLIPIFVELEANPNSPEAMTAFFRYYSSIMGYYSLFWVVMLLVNASVSAAFLRQVLRPENQAGFFPLRFGMEEIRVLGANFVAGLVALGPVFLAYAATIILVVIGALFAKSSPAIISAFLIVATIVMLTGFIFAIRIVIKLSPAAALSVRDKKFRIFEAWRVTKGRVWSMIGSFIVAYFAFFLPMMLLNLIVVFGVFFSGDTLNTIASMEETDNPTAIFQSVFDSLTAPSALIILFVIGGLSFFLVSLLQLCFAGVPAYVTQLWARDNNFEPTDQPYPSLKKN